jgi:ABC-2 type transport system permease protein
MTPSLNRCAAIAGKEWLQILRDTRSLILALFAPAFLILLFGYALSVDVSHIGFTILDFDRSTRSREFYENLMHTEYFSFKGISSRYEEIDERFNRHDISIAVVIPSGFERAIDRGESTKLQILADGSDSTSSNVALGYLSVIINSYATDIARMRAHKRGVIGIMPSIIPEPRFWYNETMKSKIFILPGLTALILAIICALIASLAISREYERGTLETLLSTPVRPYELILGKMIPYILIGIFDAVIALTLGHFLFDLPIKGNFFELILVSLLFLGGMTGLGVLISTVTRTQVLSVQFSMVLTYLPTFILSGFMFPIQNMPLIVQGITYLIPARYLITVIRGIALKGAATTILWTQIIFLAIFCIIITALAIKKFRNFLPYQGAGK